MANTVRAMDVAAYIVEKQGPISQLLLQKLLYYCQAASLLWDDTPLFNDRIEAWINGPVVPNIWRAFQYQAFIHEVPTGDISALDRDNRQTISGILNKYGNTAPQLLANRTHGEKPWLDARRGLDPGERGSREITTGALRTFFDQEWRH